MFYSKMTSRGQITIPIQFREILNIKEGEKVEFILKGEQMIIIPINRDISSLKGALPKPAKVLSCNEMEKVIKKGDNDRVRHEHTG